MERCGVTSFDKLLQLKAFVYSHHPHVIFLQEAFPGRPLAGKAPSFSGYIPYVHMVRNGLLLIHNSLTHRLLRTSTDPDVTFQLFEVTVGSAVLQICNVYFALARLHPAALPLPSVYLEDFNVRHPALGDLSGSSNRPGVLLLSYIRKYHLTRWNTGGDTHSRGGTLDHVLSSGLAAA